MHKFRRTLGASSLIHDKVVNLAPSQFEAGFMSIAHTRDDLDCTIAAARAAFREL